MSETRPTYRTPDIVCRYSFDPVVDTRPTYKIPVRELVAGMCGVGSGPHDARAVAGIREYWRGHPDGIAGNMWVMLPGPSPRELACTCSAPLTMDLYPRTAAPDRHASTCPVAPVPGEHGGLRIWPAPFKGTAWTWDQGAKGWTIGRKIGERRFFDRNDIEVATRGWHEPGIDDVVMHCFYLELPPQPERREPTPWDPWAGYYDEAVNHG